jgi:hypothetical protein
MLGTFLGLRGGSKPGAVPDPVGGNDSVVAGGGGGGLLTQGCETGGAGGIGAGAYGGLGAGATGDYGGSSFEILCCRMGDTDWRPVVHLGGAARLLPGGDDDSLLATRANVSECVYTSAGRGGGQAGDGGRLCFRRTS